MSLEQIFDAARDGDEAKVHTWMSTEGLQYQELLSLLGIALDDSKEQTGVSKRANWCQVRFMRVYQASFYDRK
jgi:hypothetical protein